MLNVNANIIQSISLLKEHCAAKIGWRVPSGHMAGLTHRTTRLILHLIYINERLCYVAMSRSDDEGSAKAVFTSVLRAWDVIELCLTTVILCLSYQMGVSVKRVSYLQVLGPHPLGPRQN